MRDEPTFEQKVASADTLTELEGMKYGLQIEARTHGREVCQHKLHLIQVRRYEIQKERGAR